MNKPPAIFEASADFIWFALTMLLILFGTLQPETYLQIRAIVVFARVDSGFAVFSSEDRHSF